MRYPPEYGPLAAVTPGTPGGPHHDARRVRHAEPRRTCSPPRSRWPTATRSRPSSRDTHRAQQEARIKEWPYSKAVFLPHPARRARRRAPGEVFRQPDLAATLRKLVEAEQQALAAGRSRQGGHLRRLRPLLQGRHRGGAGARRRRSRAGSSPKEDLARWKVKIEEPVKTTYKGHRRLQAHTCGRRARRCSRPSTSSRTPTSRRMGYNSAALHPHPLPGDEPRLRRPRLLLRRPRLPARGAGARACSRRSTRSSASRRSTGTRNDPDVRPGDPYPFQGGTNPFTALLEEWRTVPGARADAPRTTAPRTETRTTRRSAPARRRSTPPTPRAGWCR